MFENRYNLPASIALALSRQDEDYSGPGVARYPETISVSTLVGPPMLACLRALHREEIVEDVSEGLWRMLGTATHWAVEKSSPAHILSEARLQADVYDVQVSGQIDALDEDGWLDDYKTTSVWSLMLGDKPEWEAQLNCYDWLCRQNGIEVPAGLRIIAILRDWRRSEQRRDPARYPAIPIMIRPVARWSPQEQEDYLHARVEAHTQAYDRIRAAHEGACPMDVSWCCTAEERWQGPAKWAVYKNQNKRAAKLCDSEAEAFGWMALQPTGASYRVEERPSRPTRCLDYCPVREWCPFGAGLTEEEDA